MTRYFNRQVDCPACGHRHTQESEFDRWMRNNPELDASRESFVVSDFDYVFHRYKTPILGRQLQAIMFVEVKTNGAKTERSQAQTLNIARQLMRNQRGDERPSCRTNGISGPVIQVKNFGGFELRLSGTSPENSDWIEWNRKRITKDQLVSICKFDLDPITLKRMDWRQNHHHEDKTKLLFTDA